MRYSDRHDGEFYINTKGILYMYGIPMSESGLEQKYYKSYDVEQFLGIQDKNGRDAYHNDTVIHNLYGKGVIKYMASVGYYIDFGEGEFDREKHNISSCEITGNIHE